MINLPTQCMSCRHYHQEASMDSCDAFPDGIPSEILDKTLDHRKPYPGDQGIRWEPLKPGGKHPFDGGEWM